MTEGQDSSKIHHIFECPYIKIIYPYPEGGHPIHRSIVGDAIRHSGEKSLAFHSVNGGGMRLDFTFGEIVP